MKYKNVLVVSNMYPSKSFPSYGVFVKNFCDQLSEIGIRYKVSALTKTTNNLHKLVKYLLFYIITFFRSLFGGYDLVYIHYPSFSAKPVLVARKFRKFEIISNVHGTDVIPLKIEHEKMVGITREAIHQSSMVVVPSEYYKELVREKYQVSENKVFVYPSAGINDALFYRFGPDKRRIIATEYGIKPDSFVIGFVSRINKAKGWDVFLDALTECPFFEDRNIIVFIVGSGEDDDELESRINGLPENVKKTIKRYPLLAQEKLADVYNMLDVFVFPTTSASESLGLVAIEAMACGCPVIASNYAAPQYYVVDDMNGYKFDKGNSHDLQRILVQYCDLSEDFHERLRIGAIKTAKKYSKQEILGNLRLLMSVKAVD